MVAQFPTSTCPECGAALAAGRVCQDYFHDLLALEAQVPEAPGAEPHFLAVASYNLQHPAAFVPAVLLGLQQTLADVLAGKATVADARRRASRATDGPTRVRRGAGRVRRSRAGVGARGHRGVGGRAPADGPLASSIAAGVRENRNATQR